jgi:hypothetical protein
MKIRKYKNGTIRLTAENKEDSGDLMKFLAACAGEGSVFAKTAKKKKRCPYCDSDKVLMFDADNDLCHACGRYFPGT